MRPESPIPLTLEEHRELGREIRVAGARLQELCTLIAKVYGPQNRAAFSFLKVTEAIERLRQDLEAQVSQDLPGIPVDGFYL
ncbi:MAG TPA: hypothetical protein VG675_10835 [Bryobacteraceae bacterium]|nr:hypothetical protein [Bryobacteraceae bacterium]